MNEYYRAMMGLPDVNKRGDVCPFCGRTSTNAHHVVPRSQGGEKGPLVHVCGNGNESGCHGELHHHRLHLKAKDGCWWYLATDNPVKLDRAMAMEGWVKL